MAPTPLWLLAAAALLTMMHWLSPLGTRSSLQERPPLQGELRSRALLPTTANWSTDLVIGYNPLFVIGYNPLFVALTCFLHCYVQRIMLTVAAAHPSFTTAHLSFHSTGYCLPHVTN
jgi:hypothetical protein